MTKEENWSECCGRQLVVAAVLLAVGMLGGSYLLSLGNYAPQVNVSNPPSNVYVSSQAPEHTISVSASATQRVSPDLLLIQLRVQTEAANAAQSQADNARVSDELRTALRGVGVQDSDLETTSYSVDPVYRSVQRCDGGECHWTSELTGYRTTHSLSVRLTDLTKGGQVIDAAATAGTNQTFTDSVQFTLKDETRMAVQRSLLQNASVEAGAKARSIATGLGTTVGRVFSASEAYSYYPTPNYRDLSAAGAAPTTALSPGQVDVSVSVNVQYEIS